MQETLHVSPALLVGFPSAGDWRSRSRSVRFALSVSVRPQAVPEGLRTYPKGNVSTRVISIVQACLNTFISIICNINYIMYQEYPS